MSLSGRPVSYTHLDVYKRQVFRGAKTGKFLEVDNDVFKYIEELRNNSCCVTFYMIQTKACEIPKNKNLENQFKGSRGWAHRFMWRYNLSLRRRTTICQKLPADYNEKIVQFHHYVISERKSRCYLLSQIGNADQTAVCFNVPRNTTIEKKGASAVTVRITGNQKLRCTVMLADTCLLYTSRCV